MERIARVIVAIIKVIISKPFAFFAFGIMFMLPTILIYENTSEWYGKMLITMVIYPILFHFIYNIALAKFRRNLEKDLDEIFTKDEE